MCVCVCVCATVYNIDIYTHTYIHIYIHIHTLHTHANTKTLSQPKMWCVPPSHDDILALDSRMFARFDAANTKIGKTEVQDMNVLHILTHGANQQTPHQGQYHLTRSLWPLILQGLGM